MVPKAPQEVFSVLQKINGLPVETFKNFPEFIRAGSFQIPKEDYDYLIIEGYLEENKTDSFGKLLQLSERARIMLKNKE